MKIKLDKCIFLYIFCISFGFIFIISAIIALTIGNSFQVTFGQGYIPPPPISPSQNSIQSTQQTPSFENQRQQQQQQNSLVNPQSQIVGGIDMSKMPGLNNTMNIDNLPTLNNQPTLNDAPNSTDSKDVKIAFTGTVTQVDDRANKLNGNVRVGDKITGEYTYKLSTKDSNRDQMVGDYKHDKKVFGITVRRCRTSCCGASAMPARRRLANRRRRALRQRGQHGTRCALRGTRNRRTWAPWKSRRHDSTRPASTIEDGLCADERPRPRLDDRGQPGLAGHTRGLAQRRRIGRRAARRRDARSRKFRVARWPGTGLRHRTGAARPAEPGGDERAAARCVAGAGRRRDERRRLACRVRCRNEERALRLAGQPCADGARRRLDRGDRPVALAGGCAAAGGLVDRGRGAARPGEVDCAPVGPAGLERQLDRCRAACLVAAVRRFDPAGQGRCGAGGDGPPARPRRRNRAGDRVPRQCCRARDDRSHLGAGRRGVDAAMTTTRLLEGRTAIVTGAGGGVGRGIAQALAADWRPCRDRGPARVDRQRDAGADPGRGRFGHRGRDRCRATRCRRRRGRRGARDLRRSRHRRAQRGQRPLVAAHPMRRDHRCRLGRTIRDRARCGLLPGAGLVRAAARQRPRPLHHPELGAGAARRRDEPDLCVGEECAARHGQGAGARMGAARHHGQRGGAGRPRPMRPRPTSSATRSSARADHVAGADAPPGRDAGRHRRRRRRAVQRPHALRHRADHSGRRRGLYGALAIGAALTRLARHRPAAYQLVAARHSCPDSASCSKPSADQLASRSSISSGAQCRNLAERRHPPARHHAGDEAGFVAGQEQRRGGHIPGVAFDGRAARCGAGAHALPGR